MTTPDDMTADEPTGKTPEILPSLRRLPEDESARNELAARLSALRAQLDSVEALRAMGLGWVAEADPVTLQRRDLARAVHVLEHYLEPERAELSVTTLVEPDDAERHPGFDGVEQEWVDEELHLLERLAAASEVARP